MGNFLYEKVTFKSTSAEPLPRWAIGTGQSSCLQFRSGPIARRGRGGIMPFTIFKIRCVRQDMRVLYEILCKSEEYFYLCCGQNRIRIRSARGGYMKMPTAEPPADHRTGPGPPTVRGRSDGPPGAVFQLKIPESLKFSMASSV